MDLSEPRSRRATASWDQADPPEVAARGTSASAPAESPRDALGDNLESSLELGPDQTSVAEAIERTFGPGALALLRDEPGFREQTTPVDARTQGELAALIARIEEKARPWTSQRGSSGEPGAGRPRADGVKYVGFHLERLDCLVPMANVLEIQRPPRITPIPNVPAWVLGVANLRGDILSVVDLRGFLGLESLEYDLAGRIMVVRSSDHELTTGLIVDRVSGLLSLSKSRIQSPNSLAQDRITPYVRGVHHTMERHQLVLDLDELLQSSEMRQFQPI